MSTNGGLLKYIKNLNLVIIFLISSINISFLQILISPLKLINKSKYDDVIGYSKSAFSKLLILVNNSSTIRLYNYKAINKKSIIISNHQLYTDWLYLWCLLYKLNINHDKLIIILKNSLKHIPILGWGMQFFNFIFLKRNWSKDETTLNNQLGSISDDNFTLLLFPEGTTLSNESRPRSIRYTEKIGVKDFDYLLYPRVTGLLASIRALKHNNLVDIIDTTIAYPNIPKDIYGQDYYSLKSIFFNNNFPDIIHMHMNSYSLEDIPIDNDENFTKWLLSRWQEKEKRLELFEKSNTLDETDDYEDISITFNRPLMHTLDAFIWFVPMILTWLIYKLIVNLL